MKNGLAGILFVLSVIQAVVCTPGFCALPFVFPGSTGIGHSTEPSTWPGFLSTLVFLGVVAAAPVLLRKAKNEGWRPVTALLIWLAEAMPFFLWAFLWGILPARAASAAADLSAYASFGVAPLLCLALAVLLEKNLPGALRASHRKKRRHADSMCDDDF